jgi:hypothetical protein
MGLITLHKAAACFISLALLATASLAEAAPTSQEKSQAAQAYAKGKRLLGQNKPDEATALLEEAVNLNPVGKYRVELAKALIAAGSLKEALGTLDGIEDDSDKAAAKAGKKLQTELSSRLPTLAITLSNDVADVVIRIDDEEIAPGKPLALNPGMHTVVIEQNGESKEERSVVLREKDKRKLVMGAKLTATPTTPIEAPAEKSSGGTWWPAAIGYGTGGVGVVLGSTFGFLAFQTTNDVELSCNAGQCPQDSAASIDAAITYGNVSTGMFVTAGAALAAGVILTFTHGLSSSEDGKPEVALRSSVGPGGVGIAIDY